MKITSTILSIPPYLSTTWKNISSLHVKPVGNLFTLIVLMQNRIQVEVPNLNKETVDEIFEAHARAAEEENPLKNALENPISFSLPVKGDGAIESLGKSLQHNPEQADLPVLPPEALKKITLIAKAFGLEDSSVLSTPEPNCNCIYCQITRALRGEEENSENGEEISAEDLTFRDWDVKQTEDQLYIVTNPLDANEYYQVFLGTPLGCTCGHKNCEHIRAVLNS
jgi:hypothetical protein